MNKIISVAAGAVLLVALAGCGKQVDGGAVGAVQVGGISNLYRFCDGPVLIYYSDWSTEDDQYEWFWPGGCVHEGQRWVFGNQPPQPGVVPNGDSTGDGER